MDDKTGTLETRLEDVKKVEVYGCYAVTHYQFLITEEQHQENYKVVEQMVRKRAETLGLDPAVEEFVDQHVTTIYMVRLFLDLTKYWLPIRPDIEKVGVEAVGKIYEDQDRILRKVSEKARLFAEKNPVPVYNQQRKWDFDNRKGE